MSNNVFKQYYAPMRYPSNWKRNARLFFRQFKWAYQRATRGFADSDTWDMDSWLLDLLHDSLNYLAENTISYPADKEFDTFEKWANYLKDIAQKLYQAQEENHYYAEPSYAKWAEWLDKHNDKFFTSENPYSKDMFIESMENDKKRMADFEEAWAKLGKVFFNLWD